MARPDRPPPHAPDHAPAEGAWRWMSRAALIEQQRLQDTEAVLLDALIDRDRRIARLTAARTALLDRLVVLEARAAADEDAAALKLFRDTFAPDLGD